MANMRQTPPFPALRLLGPPPQPSCRLHHHHPSPPCQPSKSVVVGTPSPRTSMHALHPETLAKPRILPPHQNILVQLKARLTTRRPSKTSRPSARRINAQNSTKPHNKSGSTCLTRRHPTRLAELEGSVNPLERPCPRKPPSTSLPNYRVPNRDPFVKFVFLFFMQTVPWQEIRLQIRVCGRTILTLLQ